MVPARRVDRDVAAIASSLLLAVNCLTLVMLKRLATSWPGSSRPSRLGRHGPGRPKRDARVKPAHDGCGCRVYLIELRSASVVEILLLVTRDEIALRRRRRGRSLLHGVLEQHVHEQVHRLGLDD